MITPEIAAISLITFFTLLIAGYSFLLFKITRSLFRNLPAPGKGSDELPACRVTVIIAARNEAHHVVRLLGELECQFPVPGGVEVILSDDDSGDETCLLAESFRKQHPGFLLTILNAGPNDPPGKKGAIARALAVASGELILATDADTTHPPGWIRAMMTCFSDPGVCMVLGPVVFSSGHGLFGNIQGLEFLGIMGTTAGSALAGKPLMCNGANLAYRRSLLPRRDGELPGARFASGDDQFLMLHAVKTYGAGSVTFCTHPEAIVTTAPQPGLSAFFNQRMRWVSKSRGYRDPAVILTGLITGLLHVMLLAGWFAALAWPGILPVVAAGWLIKCLAEYPLTARMAYFTGKEKLLRFYLPAQIFQTVYVPLAGLAGLLFPFRWKGRRGLR
jgi:cellulose synthase/poly-beta-1,6-N-acetylglucosamine synthase-like glycosyltransferase